LRRCRTERIEARRLETDAAFEWTRDGESAVNERER
jgi:hypothetical protein